MKCDSPVVATDVGGVAELITGSQASTVCSEEALVNAVKDVFTSDGTDEGGRQSIQDLTWNSPAQRTLEIYDSV